MRCSCRVSHNGNWLCDGGFYAAQSFKTMGNAIHAGKLLTRMRRRGPSACAAGMFGPAHPHTPGADVKIILHKVTPRDLDSYERRS